MPRRSKASVIRMVVSLFATYRRYADSATTQLDPVTRPAIKRGDSKLGHSWEQKNDQGLAGLSVTCANGAGLGPLSSSGELKNIPCTATQIILYCL